MIIRTYEDLKFNSILVETEADIYKNMKVGLIYVAGHGYTLFRISQENWDDFVFIKTMTKPIQYSGEIVDEELLKNKDEFIEVISDVLEDIYVNSEIKEYEKKHPEYIFMELFDKFNEAKINQITRDHKYYSLIEDGFMKIAISQLQNFENQQISDYKYY